MIARGGFVDSCVSRRGFADAVCRAGHSKSPTPQRSIRSIRRWETRNSQQWVVPNPQIPRTFGLLNIIFGVLLLLTGAGMTAMLFVGPVIAKHGPVSGSKSSRAAKKAQREARIAELKRQQEPQRPNGKGVS